jgi:large subunit ribosomal protein L32e
MAKKTEAENKSVKKDIKQKTDRKTTDTKKQKTVKTKQKINKTKKPEEKIETEKITPSKKKTDDTKDEKKDTKVKPEEKETTPAKKETKSKTEKKSTAKKTKDTKEETKDTKKKTKVKKKPDLSQDIKNKLKKREEIKIRTPKFLREEWYRYKRIPRNWRRPDGITSKMRRNLKYRPSKVRVGFRGPKDVRGLHSSGFQEIIVHNVSDLNVINPKTQAARIGGTVGTKKRADIGKKAEELNIRVLNL